MGKITIAVLRLIKIYQFLISPLLGANCRFYPTCSAYAQEAIKEKGLVAGGRLTILRLLKCHPWGQSGYDPIPK